MCKETKLPLLTGSIERYRDISKFFKVKIISTEMIRKYDDAELIFKKAKIL